MKGPKAMVEKNHHTQIPCHFTSVGLQLESRKIGVRIDRQRLSVETADELFAGRRLTGTVEVTIDGEDQNQLPLINGVLSSVEASFDVKSFTTRREHYSCGLVFAIDDVSPETLVGFLNRSGKITVDANEDIPEPEKDNE